MIVKKKTGFFTTLLYLDLPNWDLALFFFKIYCDKLTDPPPVQNIGGIIGQPIYKEEQSEKESPFLRPCLLDFESNFLWSASIATPQCLKSVLSA